MLQPTIVESRSLTQKTTYNYYHSRRNLRGFVTKSAVLLIVTFILLIPVDSCRAADQASAAMRTWDQILTDDCFEDVANFNRTIRQEGNERIYMYSTFAGDAVDRELLMSIVVAVGPAGKRLDPKAWKKAFSAASDIEKVREFPKVGSRAQAQVPTFSPDGALSGVLFTTSDELFDVLVSLYEASSAAPRGSLTADNVARRIERAYLGTFH